MSEPFRYIFYKDYVLYLDDYFEYLSEVKSRLPVNIGDFFCQEKYYLLHNDLTLHDAWVEKFSLENTYQDNLKSTSIEIILLLANHEKKVQMKYLDIVQIKFDNSKIKLDGNPNDLYIHEFYINDVGNYEHTIEFRDESYVIIEFKDFMYYFTDC